MNPIDITSRQSFLASLPTDKETSEPWQAVPSGKNIIARQPPESKPQKKPQAQACSSATLPPDPS